MAKIAKYNGKIIKVNNKIGLHPSCCCEGPGCCPFTFDQVPFSVSITCFGVTTQHQGMLNFGFGVSADGLVNVGLICTVTSLCPYGNDFFGYLAQVTKFPCQVLGALVVGDVEGANTQACQSSTPGNGQVIQLINCSNANVGTLTIG